MGRPTKENSLTQQDVIEAAIAILDREGETALGVNRVARELGITSIWRVTRGYNAPWR